MFEKLCAGHEREILLLVVILVISIGKGAGLLLLQLLKRAIGLKEGVTVNVGAMDREAMSGDRISMTNDRIAMAGDRQNMTIDRELLLGHACLIPDSCPKHGEESQRSLQNQKDIAELEQQHHADREIFWKELRSIRRGIACITNGLLAKQIIDPRDMPMED